jgi:hypothetical protein
MGWTKEQWAVAFANHQQFIDKVNLDVAYRVRRRWFADHPNGEQPEVSRFGVGQYWREANELFDCQDVRNLFTMKNP